MFYVIKDDLKANKGNLKIIIILLFFRLSASIRNSNIFIKIIFIWIRLIYKVCIQWGYGIDFPDNTQAGSPIIMYHGIGLVINSDAIIMNNVILRQNITLGNKEMGGKSPIIENNVDIGANAIIIGNITIGAYSTIGAGSVVTKNVPPYSVVVGNPAKILEYIKY